MTKQLAISLANTRVIYLNIFKNMQTNSVDTLELSFENIFKEESNKTFTLIFDIKVPHKEGIVFHAKYEAIFITNEPINEEFMKSPFTKINAPAIAYPFLRAYISTLMTLSGYSPLILPTINFSEKFEEEKADIEISK